MVYRLNRLERYIRFHYERVGKMPNILHCISLAGNGPQVTLPPS